MKSSLSRDIERPVSFLAEYELFKNEHYGVIAAHSYPLGLTGYGKTGIEAVSSFKEVVDSFVQTSRDFGCLESNLDRSGVIWHYDDNPTSISVEPIPWVSVSGGKRQEMVVA